MCVYMCAMTTVWQQYANERRDKKEIANKRNERMNNYTRYRIAATARCDIARHWDRFPAYAIDIVNIDVVSMFNDVRTHIQR